MDKKSNSKDKLSGYVKKLSCDYYTFKTERLKSSLPYTKKCFNCSKKFKDNDNLYLIIEQEMLEIKTVCKDCANILNNK